MDATEQSELNPKSRPTDIWLFPWGRITLLLRADQVKNYITSQEEYDEYLKKLRKKHPEYFK